jgi:hypothetical protein
VGMKKRDLLVSKICSDAEYHSIKLTQDMEYIQNYGNMSYRKKHKLKNAEVKACKNSIYGMQIKLSILSIMVSGSNRLYKRYNKLLKLVNKRFDETLNGMEAVKNGRKK